jgi:hypothetical protein
VLVVSGSGVQQCGYRGRACARPWRRPLRCLPAAGVALLLALASGGCSFSYQLDSMFSRERANTDTTSSAEPRPQSATGMFSFAAIYAAVSEALGRSGGSASASVPWEDPSTGARGTVTPLSSAYVQDGTTCRDFLASYVKGGSESWLQGEACRSAQDRWEVRRMRPWRRT